MGQNLATPPIHAINYYKITTSSKNNLSLNNFTVEFLHLYGLFILL